MPEHVTIMNCLQQRLATSILDIQHIWCETEAAIEFHALALFIHGRLLL